MSVNDVEERLEKSDLFSEEYKFLVREALHKSEKSPSKKGKSRNMSYFYIILIIVVIASAGIITYVVLKKDKDDDKDDADDSDDSRENRMLV